MRGEGTAKGLWILFLCVFGWPFLLVADRAATVLGIPSLLLYLFAGWTVLVVALALVSRKLEE